MFMFLCQGGQGLSRAVEPMMMVVVVVVVFLCQDYCFTIFFRLCEVHLTQ